VSYTLRLDAVPVLSYAMAYNRVPVVDGIEIQCSASGTESEAELRLRVVDDEGPLSLAWVRGVTLPESGTVTVRSVDLTLDGGQIAQLQERRPARYECSLVAGAGDDEQVLATLTQPVMVLAPHQWRATPPGLGLEMLAAHVMPNAPEVGQLVAYASERLAAQTGSGSIEGYQAGPERVDQIVRALYETMQAGRIRYSEPPPSWADDGQKIRTPVDVLAGVDGRGGLATCLDTTLVLAAALEHAGIRPLVVLTEGHSFLAYWRIELALPLVAQRDTNDLVNRVDLGQVGLVETTGVCDGVDLPWDVARQRPYGTELVRPPEQIVGVMDVWSARQNQIIPMPARSRTVEGKPIVVEYRPESHSVAPAERDEERRQPATRDSQPMPARFLQWQNALIDLSLRNPLLNLSNRTGIRLAVPGDLAQRVEDRLAAGKKVTVLPYDGLGAMHDARTQSRSVVDVDEAVVADLFKRSGAVVADVSAASYVTTCRNLAYKARTVLEEMGANALHLTLGELVWELDGRELRAPLVLLPVHIRAMAGERRYEVVIDDAGQPTPNFCLAEKLRQSHQVNIPALENPPTDAYGIDLAALFTQVRIALAEQSLPFRVEMASRLAVVQFAKFRLWRDIADSWQTMLTSPLVRHLALTPTHTFDDPAAAQERPLDLDALGSVCPIPADASQVGAIGAALQGRTFVLEGPPGTGKSQTITNLLARAVADGQRVLFVAEKQAALEVVKRRLDDVGLASISLDLHDKSAKPSAIRSQIQQALDLVAHSDGAQLGRTREEQAARRRPLARYVDAVHAPNGAGLSLYGAVGRRGETDVDPMPVPEVAVAPEGSAAMEAVRAAVRLLPDVADPVGPAPSPWGFATRASRGVEIPSVYAAARDYDQVVARDSTALGVWAEVLESCRTPGEVKAVADLVRLPEVGADTVTLTCSASWGQLLQRVTGDVRALTAEGLGMAAPGALDLDLDRLLADAYEASGSFFLFRKGRLKRVAAELAGHLTTSAALPPDRVVATIESLVAARGRGRALAATITDRMPNLVLPDGWNPWQDDAITRLQTAADEVRTGMRAADPAATRSDLVDAVRAALPVAGSVDGTARERVVGISAALTALAERLTVAEDAAARWAGESGFAGRWRTTATRRALADSGHSSLLAWLALVAQVEPLRAAGMDDAADDLLTGRLDPDLAGLSLEAGLGEASVGERLARGQLGTFDGSVHERAVDRYRASTAELRAAERDGLLDAALRRRTFAATSEVGRVGSLRRDLARRRGGKSVRELLATYADLIAEIMPCALVSPDSVARFYPVTPGLFDLVVFDEASQIKVADAIGAIARGAAVVVVGDSKQMPPSTFAEVVSMTDDDAGWASGTVADEESILSECVQAGLPQHWLSWHYRSQDESLIAFSNAHYYDGRLASFPAPVRGSADPGVDGHGVSLVRVAGQFLRDGQGKDLRTNPVEAHAIVAAIIERFDAVPPGTMPSVGVVTFNVQQRALIEALLRDSGDDRLSQALDSGHEGLFVKNLENVQGDERDVIMFSTAFSVNERGVLPLNFGPLNLVGGERRLNVAITRARRQVIVFSSFDPDQLRAEETSSVGVKHLRAYLELAAAGSPLSALATVRRPVRDRHRDEIADSLRRAGLAVTTDVGLSEFRVDICLAKPEAPDVPLVAVLLDSVAWGVRRTVADRFELPAVVLEGLLRWPDLEWVWLPDWLSRPDEVVARLVAATQRASASDLGLDWEPLVADEDDIQDPEPDEVRQAGVEPTNEELFRASAGAITSHADADADAAPATVQDPRPAPQPPGLPYEQRFVPWPVRKLGDRSVLDRLPSRDASVRVGEVLSEVVAAEGPVHRDRAAKLVASAFDLDRVTAARAQAILSTLGLGREEWLWPPGVDPATWWTFRRSLPGEDRAFDHVPYVEIVNALCSIAATSRGVGQRELVGAALEVFGISRRGSRVVERVESALQLAVGTRRLALIDGLYQVVGG